MSALTVFSESIRYFKDHFLLNIRKTGLEIRGDEIHWVLTIPAISNDDSKQFMRESTKQVFNNAAKKTPPKKTNWPTKMFLPCTYKWNLKYDTTQL